MIRRKLWESKKQPENEGEDEEEMAEYRRAVGAFEKKSEKYWEDISGAPPNPNPIIGILSKPLPYRL